jgi:phosphohistidine phosphatase SixA
VVTSRLPRAIETADAALDALGAKKTPIRRDDALEPGARPEATAAAVESARAEGRGGSRGAREGAVVVWLVGHDPNLTNALARWTGASPSALRLKKGAVAVVESDVPAPREGAARLVALWQPKDLERLTSRRPRRRR